MGLVMSSLVLVCVPHPDNTTIATPNSVRNRRAAGILRELPGIDSDEVVQYHGKHRQRAEPVRKVVQSVVGDHCCPMSHNTSHDNQSIEMSEICSTTREAVADTAENEYGPESDVVVAANRMCLVLFGGCSVGTSLSARTRSRNLPNLSTCSAPPPSSPFPFTSAFRV